MNVLGYIYTNTRALELWMVNNGNNRVQFIKNLRTMFESDGSRNSEPDAFFDPPKVEDKPRTMLNLAEAKVLADYIWMISKQE